MAQTLSNNIGCFNTVNNVAAADERSNILSWLSPLEPKLRHKDIQDRRVENIGEWVLETEEFKSWYASSGGNGSDNAILFCYGDPGVGKTFISSLVMDKLGDWAGGQGATVAGFYFDYAAQKEQSPTNMLGAVLKQAVGGLREVPEEIAQAFEGQKHVIGGRGPQLAEIVKMLQNTASIKPTFICIDALDECVARDRVKILASLNQILQRSPGTRMFVTGRPHIEAEVGKRLSGRGTAIRITPRRHDIISFLNRRLEEDTTPDAMDDNLKGDILKKISKDVSEMFLLVSLNVDTILQGTTIRSRRKRLDEMTDDWGLEGAYGATLGRIKGQGGEKCRLGMATLMWIFHSEQPLRVDELCHALGVEIGSADLHGDNIPSISTLLGCCKGLVSVDKEASIVRLIHFTLQEYFQAHPEHFDRPQAAMAETCLSYLNSHQVTALSPNSSPHYRDHHDTPFLEYSSLYWGVHARRDLSDNAKQLALRLFDDYSNHISPTILFNSNKRVNYFGFYCDKPLLPTGLHYASFFGIDEIVACLVEVEGCNINAIDCTGSTPLAWAASNGHSGVVKILLGRDGVNPNSLDKRGQMPLHRAAVEGHEGVVKILLGRGDVNPGQPDDKGLTPLWYATMQGREGVMEILLGRNEVDPNQLLFGYGQTPLGWAASRGLEGAVQILLGRDDTNPDKPDIFGKTPLQWVAKNGHVELAGMLVRRHDVNPNQLIECGRTPLCWALENGHRGIVDILLGRDDVDLNKPTVCGETPLWWAAKNGHVGMVEMLLGKADVNPNRPDMFDETPLGCAAKNGHDGVVEMLLARSDISPDKPDRFGRTPLQWVARNGRVELAGILVGRHDVNPNQLIGYRQTPLCWAFENGHEGIVGILLGRGDVDFNKPSRSGKTPLWWAAKNGHVGMVEMLLRKDNVSPDRPDEHGRTPLWCAAENGHEGVVKMLLRRGDVNPDKPDIYGMIPLLCAAASGRDEVVKTLLSWGNVNPGKPDMYLYGQAPLFCATGRGHAGLIALLQPRVSAAPSTA